MSVPLLEIRSLSIAFGTGEKKSTVVSHLHLAIARGQCMALVGESGSGKSLTALSILQLLPIAARVSERSQILFQGNDLLRYSEKAMRHVRGFKIGMIFQDAMSAFNPVLTIGQQMREIVCRQQPINPQKTKSTILHLLQEVGLEEYERVYRSYPHQLSGGMRQRAMIAMALCGEPEIILADEPTTALDVTLQAQVLDLLQSLKIKRQLSLLFISHDLAVVSRLADEVTVLQHGHCVEQSTSALFFRDPQHEYSRHLLAAIPTLHTRHLSPVTSPAVLQVNCLKVYFPIRKGIFKRHVGDIRAVDGISFTLPVGSTLALVGESGSGKTTTAKAIVRLLPSTAGHIHLGEKNLLTLSSRQLFSLRNDVQMIFQDPDSALNPRRMIADSISEAMEQKSRRRRLVFVDELLEQVGLLPEHKWRYPHEFSGGERQRICIARALALKPKVLILDEPTSALDVSIQMQILRLLEDLQARYQLAYLLITHNVSLVAYLADYLAIMHQGKIIEQGPTEKILSQPQQDYTQQLLASIPTLAPSKKPENGI